MVPDGSPRPRQVCEHILFRFSVGRGGWGGGVFFFLIRCKCLILGRFRIKTWTSGSTWLAFQSSSNCLDLWGAPPLSGERIVRYPITGIAGPTCCPDCCLISMFSPWSIWIAAFELTFIGPRYVLKTTKGFRRYIINMLSLHRFYRRVNPGLNKWRTHVACPVVSSKARAWVRFPHSRAHAFTHHIVLLCVFLTLVSSVI